MQGKKDAIELAVSCLLAEGHLLIEDVPGVGKTSLAKAMAASVHCTWKRVQFTPDLLPADLVGVSIFQRSSESFVFQRGPLFANIVLADEINRASPKTQSALLEAMEERQVSADGASHMLPEPFMVIATQNPVEQEGTYRLPESQLDRFLMRLSLGYPDRNAELAIVQTHGANTAMNDLQAVVTTEEVMALIEAVRTVHLALTLQGYMVDLAEASRRHPALLLGLSPRATLQLSRADTGTCGQSGSRVRNARRRQGGRRTGAVAPSDAAARRDVSGCHGRHRHSRNRRLRSRTCRPLDDHQARLVSNCRRRCLLSRSGGSSA